MKATKPCKGLGIAKGHGCNTEVRTETRQKGLCIDCYRGFIFSGTEEGEKEKEKFFIKNSKVVTKEKKVRTKKQKIESKSIKVLIQDARQPFQKLIRIRDHRKTCICCDNILPYDIGKYDAGHCYKAEIYTGLIFHPDNVHGQQVYCNQHLHGNESGYVQGLVKRIGWADFNKLTALSKKVKSYRWDRYKLIEMKAYYTMELKAVEKGTKDIKDVDFTIGIIN